MTEKTFVGYCEGPLPIRRGDWVEIKKGTLIKTMCRPDRHAGRTYRVKVDHVLSGSGYPPGHPELAHIAHFRDPPKVSNPSVRWAGSGGYWCEVDINDVTKVEAPNEAPNEAGSGPPRRGRR